MKEKEFKIRRWQCTTRRCSLCPKKFKSTKELNDHISNEHNYKFLCKFCPCHKAYSSKLIGTCVITPLADTNVTNVLRCFMRSMSGNLILTLTEDMATNVCILNMTESTSHRPNIIGICSPTPSTRKKSTAMFVIRLLTLRNILMSTLRSMRISYQRNPHTVGKGFGGVQALGSTSDRSTLIWHPKKSEM